MGSKYDDTHDEQIRTLYSQHVSVAKIAAKLRLGTTTVYRHLQHMGVKTHPRDQTNLRQWAGTTAQYRLARTAAASKANMGRNRSAKEKNKRAATIFENQQNIYDRERRLHKELSKRIDTKIYFQYNIGPYNVDLAIPTHQIAVELQKGLLSNSSSMKPARITEITDAGWRVIVCYSARTNHFDFPKIAETISTNLYRLSQSPPGLLVLYQDGRPTTAYDDFFAEVPTKLIL